MWLGRDSDDARKTGFVIGMFVAVLGGWAGHPDDARAKGFGNGLFFDVAVHGWVMIRTMPEKRGLEVEYLLPLLRG